MPHQDHGTRLLSPASALIDIVEDDEPLAQALMLLFESAGLKTRHFSSGERYLKAVKASSNDPRLALPGCVLLDIRLTAMSGLLVFDQLNRLDRVATKPVIFITGHGLMSTAVDVLTRGAFDFISKPFISEELLDKVQRAVRRSVQMLEQASLKREVADRVSSLTPKEHLVMRGIVAGKSNRQVSLETANSVRTIELHRARVLEKMGVSSAVELSSLLALTGFLEEPPAAPKA